MESTEFVADFVTTAGAMGTDDEDDDERKSENGKVKSENYPPPPSLRSLPSVAMGIATLRGYRMTSSHSSKDPLRPPVSEGESVWCVLVPVVTDSSPCRGIEGVRSPPETGGSTPQGGGGG